MMHWATAAVLAVATSTPAPGLPDPEQVTAMSPELETQLAARVAHRGNGKDQRLRLLVEFVIGEHGLSLDYDGTLTRTVQETADSGKANCLSFTLLFVALARKAGLEAHVQEIPKALAWYRQDGIIHSASHVNVKVRAGGAWQTIDVGSGNVLVGRDRPRAISDERGLAYFYNNRGAERRAAGAKDAARMQLDKAIELDHTSAAAWNNLGVLHVRNGDSVAAEQAYNTALEQDPVHAAALSNMVSLYQRNGDDAQATKLLRRLRKAQLADPFHQFLLANEFEKHGDHTHAVIHYQRAIRLHGKEHVFHFSLARTYLLMGDTRRASKALARAYALSDQITRHDYQARIDGLQRPTKPAGVSVSVKATGP